MEERVLNYEKCLSRNQKKFKIFKGYVSSKDIFMNLNTIVKKINLSAFNVLLFLAKKVLMAPREIRNVEWYSGKLWENHLNFYFDVFKIHMRKNFSIIFQQKKTFLYTSKNFFQMEEDYQKKRENSFKNLNYFWELIVMVSLDVNITLGTKAKKRKKCVIKKQFHFPTTWIPI